MSDLFTIVLVDDDNDEHEFFSEAIENISEAYKIKLITFSNGEELIKWLKEETVLVNVFFLDINMPFLDGFETLLMLKEIEAHRSTPVIVYSLSTNPEDKHKAYTYGANLYYSKMIPVKDLPAKLKLIIDSVQSETPLKLEDFSVSLK